MQRIFKNPNSFSSNIEDYSSHVFLRGSSECSAYLAAMIDGEGSVMHRKQTGDRVVSISNTEIEILNNCKKCCDVLGIKCSMYTTGVMCTHGLETRLTIRGQSNLYVLYQNAGHFMCNRKRKLLEEALRSYKYRMKVKLTEKTLL